MHAFLWTLIKVLIASLVAGMILNHLGITPDELLRYSGTSRERLEELARQGFAWAPHSSGVRRRRGSQYWVADS